MHDYDFETVMEDMESLCLDIEGYKADIDRADKYMVRQRLLNNNEMEENLYSSISTYKAAHREAKIRLESASVELEELFNRYKLRIVSRSPYLLQRIKVCLSKNN